MTGTLLPGTVAGDVLAPVRDFDRFLGDASDPSAVISTERSIELDERSEFPTDTVAAVDAWGLQRYYVPAEYGGLLTDAIAPLLMIRHLARRDVTAAVAHGKTFLGSVCAWVVGGDIAARMAAIAVTGDPVSWGLTERGGGSDLSHGTTAAHIADRGIRVEGTKWPINNASRGRAMTVLARTDQRHGPRSLSLVLVDKHEIDAATITYERKVATHGIRGADISGIRFRSTTVDSANLVGPVGHGLEIVLKSLQLTRPLTTGLSLGAADQGLAIALEFADTRRLYGRRLAELPGARRVLAEAVADTLLAEVVMFAGVRSAHETPAEMSLVSALVKFLGAETVDLLFRDLTHFVGARSQLVGVAGAGAFQKAARDNRVVGIFDGNSIVNLHVIVNEFGNMTRDGNPPDLDAVLAVLRPGYADRLPTSALRLVSRHGSSMLRALPGLVDMLEAKGASVAALAPARRIAADYRALLDEAADLPRQSQPDPLAFHLAERFALTFGAACAVAFWLARRGSIHGPLSRDDAWLAAVLQRLSFRLGGDPIDNDVAYAVTEAALEARTSGVVTLLSDWLG
ncbi:acyl-CoA dehydrogenase family protein [Micromonospora sp. DT81.3]|uniref:acyl-CoA dehydrogenase family protein n=1 Tax=Micromonospora sp. DT81.3 TaxID=3416523 RepID=UPI003CF3D537